MCTCFTPIHLLLLGNGRASVEIYNTGIIYEGDEIELHCNINSNPKATSFHWWENSKMIYNERTEKIVKTARIGSNLYYHCGDAKNKKQSHISVKKEVPIEGKYFL